MIQLTYQPALDPFHTIFRMMRLRWIILETGMIHFDHLRILDFFLLFPFRIDEIRLKPQDRRYRRLASSYSYLRPYGDLPASVLLFERMKPIEKAAMETMVNLGMFSTIYFHKSEVVDMAKPLPVGIDKRISELNNQQSDLLEFLRVLAIGYPFFGGQGIKARTGLLEHRYDPL